MATIQQSDDDRPVALTPELSGFLIELSIALHRHAMYPQGHPSIEPAAAGVVSRLTNLLAGRASLSLGVSRTQLIIEGVATDPKHPVLHELADRLYRHHIGAIRFEPGTDVGQLADLLRVLAVEAECTGEPLGMGPPEALRAWPNITLDPITYGQLEAELSRSGAHLPALVPLVKRLGTDAIPVLLRVMERSESRGVRRATLDMLRDFGEDAGRAAAERLTDGALPWYVQRNLLGLLAETGHWPSGLDASRYLDHLDARVRREAYRILFQVPAERDRALCTGIADDDPRNVLQALLATQERLPSAAVPLLARRLQDAELPDELRAHVVRALGASDLPLARDTLLRTVKARRRLFGGVRLAPPTPARIAALRVLATRWRDDRAAGPTLSAAARSRHPHVREAVSQPPS